MALIAEELVQEWLNRDGYFTLRGARLGNHELDLLAIKVQADGTLHCRHIEVNAAVRPIGYLGPVTSAKTQSLDEQRANARLWAEGKFNTPAKEKLRARLAPGQTWSLEVVLHKLKGPVQLDAIREQGIRTHRLSDVLQALKKRGAIIQAAGGQSLFDLTNSGEST